LGLAHRRIRHVLTGTPHHWHHVLGAMQVVTARHTAGSVALLREVAQFAGRLALDESHGLPHAMPPEDLLRGLAVQALGRWDRSRHRDVIARVASRADDGPLAAMARAALR